MQVNGPNGHQYFFHQGEDGRDLRVVFGRLAGDNEPTTPCVDDPGYAAPIYYVGSLQNNPAQP